MSLLCACSDRSLMTGPDDDARLYPIVLSGAYPTSTRASDDGFEEGDRMGVYVMDYLDDTRQGIDDADVHASNVRYDFNGAENRWSANIPIYWTSKHTPADIIGYYPYAEDVDVPKAHVFSVVRRQDEAGSEDQPGGYEASDFLWAKADKVMPTASIVNLTFRHVMAGVRVTLKEGTGFAPGEWAALEKTVLIPNIHPSTTINLEDGTPGEAFGEEISVCPYKYGEDWRAIVSPQRIDAGMNIVDISVDGIGYHLKKDTPTGYEAGKLNTFTLEVNKRADTGDFDFVLKDEAIVTWIDDVDFRDGIVRDYLIVNVETRGTLKEVVEKKGITAGTVSNIKITGEIINEDFEFLRDECTDLQAINLSDATVWGRLREYDKATARYEYHEYINVMPPNAFRDKTILRHIVFPKTLRVIGESAFTQTGLMGSLILPEGLERIEDSGINFGCFEQCKFKGDLSLPSTLKFIGVSAFKRTSFNGELKIPEGVTEIGECAFSHSNFTGDLIIPESVVSIGKSAFSVSSFTGKLKLPNNLTTIGNWTFEDAGFSGLLSLPAGLRSIGNKAFYNCGFSGELILPTSLQTIGNEAFAGTKIGGVVLHDGIAAIGEGAFMDCKYLRGSIKWPKKVQRVNDRMFYGCSQLAELILHEDVLVVGGGILYDCTLLKNLICNSIRPPLVNSIVGSDYLPPDYIYTEFSIGAFDGMSKNNITLKVPQESAELYRQAEGWKEFGRISATSDFVCRPATACALNTQHRETLMIECSGEWEVMEIPGWCSLSKSEGKNKQEVSLTIHELPGGADNRAGKIVFRQKGTDITTECDVSQYNYVYPENHCLTLQKATKGEKGIDILFVGDGWDAGAISNGSYLELVKEQMEAFFGIEPFTTYRKWFNVYACIALSQETGVNTTAMWRNTRFNTVYYHEQDKLTIENIDDVFDYAVSFSPLTSDRMNESLVIMTLNSDEYGSGTTMTEYGAAVSICSPGKASGSMDTRAIVQHEACGHGFGKLADEKIQRCKYLSNSDKEEIKRIQGWPGWYQNISITGKISEVHWNHLIFDPRYSDKVDVFEGAYGVQRGVFRAEENSCMNNGIPYFSAIARQDIMQRIHWSSGLPFSMGTFYETDSDKWGPTSSSRSDVGDGDRGYPASAFHHQVSIVKSKKY